MRLLFANGMDIYNCIKCTHTHRKTENNLELRFKNPQKRENAHETQHEGEQRTQVLLKTKNKKKTKNKLTIVFRSSS